MKFSGLLRDFSLPDLLRILIQGHKVGYVVIFSKGQQSRIYVKDGELHHAESEGLTGESAVFNLLTYDPNSQFEFIEETTFLPPKTITSDLDSLIQNGIAYLEEWRKITKLYPRITVNTEISLTALQLAPPANLLQENIIRALERTTEETLLLY